MQNMLCKAGLACLVVTALAGCATMDAESCQFANWHQMGTTDGGDGRPAERIDRYAQECLEFGIEANKAAYRVGWQEGIKSYCTRDNGYETGRSGEHYEGTCPDAIRDRFYVGYAVGRKIFEAQAEVDRVEYDLNEVRDEASKDGLTGDQRGALRAERKALEDDLDSANWALSDARLEAQRLGFPVY